MNASYDEHRNLVGEEIGDDFSTLPPGSWHSHKWSGIALAPNGKLYCAPFTASKVLRIDPATNATELIGDVLERPASNYTRFSGITAAADGKLYCSPNRASMGATRVLCIDPATSATEFISVNSLGSNGGCELWSGIAAAVDGKLYCSPQDALHVLRIDPATGSTEQISDVPNEGGGDAWSGIAAGKDGTLYCSPMGATRVLRISKCAK